MLQSGYHDNAALWSQADTTPPAVGPAVFPGISTTSRVCAYDRPGTLDYTKNPPAITTRSSPVPMPRTAGDVVRELHTLLARASIPPPYVLVGHSLGGLFTLLYARTYPDHVVGLVLVDAFSPEIPAMFGAAWPAYLIATGSDHYIQVRQPDVVISATRLVIERSRHAPRPPST